MLQRYRSSSRGRSRSETPPHWKREQQRLTKDIPKIDLSNRAQLEARWAKGACTWSRTHVVTHTRDQSHVVTHTRDQSHVISYCCQSHT